MSLKDFPGLQPPQGASYPCYLHRQWCSEHAHCPRCPSHVSQPTTGPPTGPGPKPFKGLSIFVLRTWVLEKDIGLTSSWPCGRLLR